MEVKLWHDDVRPAPAGWLWARTNAEAKRILREHSIEVISLDHDLGYHDVVLPEDPNELAEVLLLKGDSEETGADLVKWMVETRHIPRDVRVHSWNPAGARRMAQLLHDAGHSVRIEPFKP